MVQLSLYLTTNDLKRRRAVSPLKIKIPSKNMRENQQMQQLFIKFINYVWYLLHVSALNCHHQGAFLLPSERCSIEEQWRGAWRSQIATNHVTRHNTPIHNILSTAPVLSISQKALGMLPEDGNIVPKHLGDSTHN
jgi:hypothetical protein